MNRREKEVRKRRTQTLVKLWKRISSSPKGIDPKRFQLNHALVTEVVEHYISDWKILKKRYHITNRIQLHKVAGLMAAAILRYRPITPKVQEFQSKQEAFANETFAIVHGLALCGEHTYAQIEDMPIFDEPWFSQWFHAFEFLLHHRNYSTEGIIFTFETLSRTYFSENFQKFERSRKNNARLVDG